MNKKALQFHTLNRKASFLRRGLPAAVFIFSALLCLLPFPGGAAGKGQEYPGEKIITFKTKDGVQIIGSLFLPYEMIKKTYQTPYDSICGESMWYQLEKELRETKSVPGNSAQTERRKITAEAGVPVENEKGPEDRIKTSCFFRSGEMEPDPYDIIFYSDIWNRMLLKKYRYLTAGKRVMPKYVQTGGVDRGYRFEEYLPKRTAGKKEEHIWQSFLDSVLTLYGEMEKDFKLEGTPAPAGDKKPAKKEPRKPAVNKPSPVLSGEGFSLAMKGQSRLKDSCFDTSFYGRPGKKYPAVLLFHMWQRNRYEWMPLIPHLQDAGFVVLAIDLRGHGESLAKGSKKLVLEKFYTKDFADMILDSFGAYEQLCSLPFVDGDDISAVGASIGTMVSVLLCERVAQGGMRTPLSSVVLMSPGKNFFGVYINDLIKNCEETPFLFFLDKQDPSATERDIFISGTALYKSFKGVKKAVIFDGVGHGTLMFNDKATVPAMVEWLKIYSSVK